MVGVECQLSETHPLQRRIKLIASALPEVPAKRNNLLYTKNRVLKFIGIRRGGYKDDCWKETQRTVANGAYMDATVSSVDPTATYEVDYIALDQYAISCNVQTITGNYASNIKTIVDDLSTNQADMSEQLTATTELARRIYNVPEKTTKAMTLYVNAAAASEGDGSAEKPYKTIQRAIDSIPQIVNHSRGHVSPVDSRRRKYLSIFGSIWR